MRFVTFIKFTTQGVSKFRDTTKRAKEFAKQAKSAGINIEQQLWTQGRFDGVLVFEAADSEIAAATMLSLSAKGNVQTETMVAFDAEGMERVLAKSK
jgi:uncharacterized protein with GYD domain